MNNPVLLADAVVAFHLLYVAFSVGGELFILVGGILKWKWIRNIAFRSVHLVAVLFVAAESLLGILCPLTKLENRLRSAAGQNVEGDITFIGSLIRKIIFYDFPPWVFTALYTGFGALVVVTFVVFPPKRRATKRSR